MRHLNSTLILYAIFLALSIALTQACGSSKKFALSETDLIDKDYRV